jgi:hypothetical protein
VDECRDHADELQRPIGRVTELMKFIGGNVKDVACFQGVLTPIAKDHTLAGGDEDFMFIVVLVFGSAAAGRNSKAAHGEVGAAVIGTAEHLHLNVVGAAHGDILLWNGCKVFKDHGAIRAGAAGKEKSAAFFRLALNPAR